MKLLHIGDEYTVSLLDFSILLDAYYDTISQFQIVRTGERTFVMRIVKRIGFNEQKACSDLTEQFRSCIHPDVQIEWEFVEFISEGPSGKALYFIDKFEKNT